MKLSVLYYSVTGNTRHMADCIAQGMNSVEGAEAKAFSMDAMDEDFVRESRCLVLGCPTYAAGMPADFHALLGKTGKLDLAGKLGGAFATAQYTHGGGELAIQNILTNLMVKGMPVYSGGMAWGKPVIHLAPVAIATAGNEEMLKPYEELFRLYGQRMAAKTLELFG